MERLKVGDEVAIAGILKVSAIQPNMNGTVSYSFDRGFALHENMVEQMELKPYKKPVQEEVVEKPTYNGKVIATSVKPAGILCDEAYLRVGRIFEFKDGLLVGNRSEICSKYGFAVQASFPYESFDDFTSHHTLNTWLEIKS